MYFFLYRDSVNQWRWRLLAANHRIIADSAEGYVNRADALAGINLVKNSFNAPVYEQ